MTAVVGSAATEPGLATIIYASAAVRPMTEADLGTLLAAARARNAALGVTGMLLYAHESFMQQLEGAPEAIGAIFASITADPRHRNLRLLTRRPIRRRRFSRWSMGFDHPQADRLADRLPGYRPTIDYPLASAELVPNAEIAEALLAMNAGA